MTTLTEYLEAENAKTIAWINEDPTNRWAGTYVTDAAHWAERGVFTVEDLHLYEMRVQYSDLHKDAYGFRPRYVNVDDLTAEQLKADTDRMIEVLKENERARAEWEAVVERAEIEQEMFEELWADSETRWAEFTADLR